MSDTDIIVEVEDQEHRTIYSIDASVAYTKMHRFIENFMGVNAQTTTEQGRLSMLVRVGVKGILLMYGEKILDSVFTSKDHPRPGKKDDLVSWYTDIFTKIALSQMVKNVTILSGEKNEHCTKIIEIHSRPNTEDASA